MQSLKSAVRTALLASTALSTLNSVDPIYPRSFTNLPTASYFEVDNFGNLFADDLEMGSDIMYQIDLWGSQSVSLTNYALGVDDAMTGIGFVRTSAQDLYENDTQINHKAMRYRMDYSDPDF